MKKLWIFLMAIMPFIVSCSNDDEELMISPAPERFTIDMAVTNNEGVDLVYLSEDYLTSGDYAKKFKLESWEAYLGDKLVQSAHDDPLNRYKSTYNNDSIGYKLISLDTDGRMQKHMKDWNKKHNATYLLTSPSLFGDAKEHVIDLEIQGIEDKVKQTFVIEFSIFVDGIEQEVFYPHFWEGLYPKGHAFRPYFILNVDKL